MPGSWNSLKLLVPLNNRNIVKATVNTVYGDNLKDNSKQYSNEYD